MSLLKLTFLKLIDGRLQMLLAKNVVSTSSSSFLDLTCPLNDTSQRTRFNSNPDTDHFLDIYYPCMHVEVWLRSSQIVK